MIDEPPEDAPPTFPPFSGHFFYNQALLAPGLAAPVPLVLNERVGFRAALRDLLVLHRAAPVLVEPATVIGGSLLFGCQEYLAGCHDLIAAAAPVQFVKASHRLLAACREFSGNLDGIYALQQATDGLPAESGQPGDEGVACARLKNYALPLERYFEAPPFAVRMDLERRGLLEVHLDSVYDEACRQLERFYLAALRKTSAPLFVQFARGLYRDVTRRLVPDHIFDLFRKSTTLADQRPGLLDLLPELEESVKKTSDRR
ncbi:MAG: hypothetical protein HY717_18015 [Planctomycetes bacterium]|nr:hypothetical protein [Planctomycetota bacterium]